MTIHSTAVIEKEAELGRNVSIGPFAYIQAGARIGDDSVIGPHAVVYRHTTLGQGCRVHAGAVLGDLPQDISFKEQESFVVIGNRCILREGVTVHRGTKAGSTTTIGDDCFLMGFSHYAHNVKLGNGVVVANGALLAGYVEVGERAFISGNATIHQFVRIGRLAMLGGLSGIGKDVPPFCTTRSLWRNTVIGLNSIGLRRAGMNPAERQDLKSAFKVLYHSGLNTSQAVARIKQEFTSAPVLEFCAFIESSKRGICGTEGEADEEDQA